MSRHLSQSIRGIEQTMNGLCPHELIPYHTITCLDSTTTTSSSSSVRGLPSSWSMGATRLLAIIIIVVAIVIFRSPGGPSYTPAAAADAGSSGGGGADGPVFHLIPHSHCDAGWLFTFDQYYVMFVRDILNSVSADLSIHPDHRFVWADIAFLNQWWMDVSTSNLSRTRFADAVARGQLQISGGGWVMADEAVTHYRDLVSQLQLGHQWVRDYLPTRGKPIRVGWQIDPFGATSTMGYLFSSCCMDSLVLNRIPSSILSELESTKSMEFRWLVAPEEEEHHFNHGEIFGHVLDSHYSSPSGFDFEALPINNPAVTPRTIAVRARQLVSHLLPRAKLYRSRHILVPIGNDFRFVNASAQFTNFDLLVEFINSHPDQFNLTIRYSTTQEYFDSVLEDDDKHSLNFPKNSIQSFLPYDHPAGKAQWVGFYASRPLLKAQARAVSALLHSSEIIFALSSVSSATPSLSLSGPLVELNRLRSAVAILQHHDAITGTSTQDVVNAYSNLLANSSASIRPHVSNFASKLLGVSSSIPPPPSFSFSISPSSLDTRNRIRLDNRHLHPSITSSPKSQSSSSLSTKIHVAIHNPLSWSPLLPVRIWFEGRIPSRILNVSDLSSPPSDPSIPFGYIPSTGELAFPAELPPLGLSTFSITLSFVKTSRSQVVIKPFQSATEDSVILNNDDLEASFDPVTGNLLSIKNLCSGVWTNLTQSFVHYDSTVDGPYSFNPDHTTPLPFQRVSSITPIVMQGSFFVQITQQLISPDDSNPPWAQSYRLYRGPRGSMLNSFLEVESLIGPLQQGQNLVSRWSSDLKNGGSLILSNNGLLPVTHKFNASSPFVSNFRPSVDQVELRDSKRSLVFVSDRPTGVVSTLDGDLQILLHRRLAHPDPYGGGNEVMNDETTLPIRYWVSLLPSFATFHEADDEGWCQASSDVARPVFAAAVNNPPRLLVDSAMRFPISRVTPLLNPLPWPLQVLSLSLESSFSSSPSSSSDPSSRVLIRIVSMAAFPIPLDIHSLFASPYHLEDLSLTALDGGAPCHGTANSALDDGFVSIPPTGIVTFSSSLSRRSSSHRR